MSEYRKKKKMPNENIPSLECGAEKQISTINNQNTEKKADKICCGKEPQCLHEGV